MMLAGEENLPLRDPLEQHLLGFHDQHVATNVGPEHVSIPQDPLTIRDPLADTAESMPAASEWVRRCGAAIRRVRDSV